MEVGAVTNRKTRGLSHKGPEEEGGVGQGVSRRGAAAGMLVLLSEQGEQSRINELAVLEKVLPQKPLLLEAALFEDTG